MSPRHVLSALPDAALGLTFLLAWTIAPDLLGGSTLAYLMLTMLLEFVIIHSSALMGALILAPTPDRHQRVWAMLGLAVFYSVFVCAFALAFGQWWPVWAFWGLTLNRLSDVLLGTVPDAKERNAMMAGWVRSVVLYLLGAFATTLLPMPRFAISDDVVRAARLPGSGEWVDEPYRVLAFGAFYYLMQAWCELGAGQGRSAPVQTAQARQNDISTPV